MLTVYSPMLWKWRKEDLIQFYYMITWALPLAINLWHGGYGFHNLVEIFANIITMHYFYLKYGVYKGSYNKIFKEKKHIQYMAIVALPSDLSPWSWTMNFTNLMEDVMEIETMHLVLSQIYMEVKINFIYI